MTGGILSDGGTIVEYNTDTSNEPVPGLPAASLALHSTVVVTPTWKREPEAGSQEIVISPSTASCWRRPFFPNMAVPDTLSCAVTAYVTGIASGVGA
jgi:hypothetical protein